MSITTSWIDITPGFAGYLALPPAGHGPVSPSRTGTTELPNPTLSVPEVPFRTYVEYRLEAESSKEPAAAAQKLGLTEEQRLSAELYWMTRFKSDPQAREAYESLASAIRKSRAEAVPK